MKRLVLAVAAVAVLAAPAAQVSAWGSTGHRLIGMAAMRALPDELPAFLRTPGAVADIAGAVGAESMGSQFAIFTLQDWNDEKRRNDLINIVIDCWREVAEHAKAAGLKYVFWEPMSVGREFGHTIAECRRFDKQLAEAKLAIPFRMIVDIDHGDTSCKTLDAALYITKTRAHRTRKTAAKAVAKKPAAAKAAAAKKPSATKTAAKQPAAARVRRAG